MGKIVPVLSARQISRLRGEDHVGRRADASAFEPVGRTKET